MLNESAETVRDAVKGRLQAARHTDLHGDHPTCLAYPRDAVFLATQGGQLGILGRGSAGVMSEADSAPRRFERRWAPRYAYRAELEIEWGSALLRASTRDVSANGMFIESADPLWVGAGFSARLALEKPVKIDCSVKRVEPGLGMAVTLQVPDKTHHEEYLNLLNSLSKPRP